MIAYILDAESNQIGDRFEIESDRAFIEWLDERKYYD